MKRIISILIILVLLFLSFEFGINLLKNGHEISYKIYVGDNIFNIVETYDKKNGDFYLIKIENQNNQFYYIIKNNYNKQKKIIKKIEYFNEDDNTCIYPILNNEEGLYLECIKDGKLYTASSYTDQNFISKIKATLEEKGYNLYKLNDMETIDNYMNSTIYTNNLIENDIVTLWNYKGINTISSEKKDMVNILGFDKYENNHGCLVDNYYIIPNYLSSKVLEFSSVNVIDLNKNEIKKIELGYTLSSDTYINGVVDNKLYYTDPSNLLQLEINPKKANARLIGSKELGGTVYNGKWENINIYDFVKTRILFQKELPKIDYLYEEIIGGYSSYYFYNSIGEVYQLTKNDLNNPILLFRANGLNNFNVIDDTVYYVQDNTLYYYSNKDGIIPVLKNNELHYNTKNRISIYRNL